MSSTALILGGSGYIGSRWASRLAKTGRFDRIVVADIGPRPPGLVDAVEHETCDVRHPLHLQLPALKPDWIFNFAAVHREPGHGRLEYFGTNLPGAAHGIEYARRVGCSRILFTSSIAAYGPTCGPTDEACATTPTTAYGISKLTAEWMHRAWQAEDSTRKLVVCRPGVIYGPGDPGNILRLIQAVKRGYFVFPGSRDLRKSYGYIEGLLDSFEHTMELCNSLITYNYVERETLPLGELVDVVGQFLGKHPPAITIPLPVLVAAAGFWNAITGGRSPVHPDRVRKVATSTHIVPKFLMQSGFQFNYSFAESLQHWASRAPEDFN